MGIDDLNILNLIQQETSRVYNYRLILFLAFVLLLTLVIFVRIYDK